MQGGRLPELNLRMELEANMPRYFFHLWFGERTIRDEEGIELPSRSAARVEAEASIRELTVPKIGSNPRRWASRFLEVSDDRGQFLRLPIGYPALEIVRPHTQSLQAQEVEVNETRPAATGAALALSRDLWKRRQDTHRLLERSRELSNQLSSLFAVSKNLRMHSRRVVEEARLVGGADRVSQYAGVVFGNP